MTRTKALTAIRISYALLPAAALLPSSAGELHAAEPASGAKPPAAECALLDESRTRGMMDGLLVYLLRACGRENELGQVRQSPALESVPGEGSGIPDVPVNDPSGDTEDPSTTQSETSIARSELTGTYCSGFNDSHLGSATPGEFDFTGFGRSTDGGATWDDRGKVPPPSSGDPSLVWRRSDGRFYIAALRSGGLGIWRSDDDCQSFTFVSQIVSFSDDKEIMAVDNAPSSPFYGRLYVAWTDFGTGDRIHEAHSDDGGATWSAQVPLSSPGADVQGAWPAVAPNGDVFVGWVRWNPWVPDGDTTMDIEIVRSTDGGGSWAQVTPPLTGAQHPSDAGASASCSRPALQENVRYLPSPQLAVGPDGALHAVYSYDPDAYDVGDVVDVYYRRSTDSGATWDPEVRLNDDLTLNDQYFPTLSVSAENIVVATWYDRRLDPANALQDTYRAISSDGGVTWQPNVRVSDVSTAIYLDPDLATCYHGDYDQNTQENGYALLQWSDDRNLQNGHDDPDVWFELEPVGSDFLLVSDPGSAVVCAPFTASFQIEVLQFQGFSEPVTLTTAGEPPGSSVSISPNPVMPGNDGLVQIGVPTSAPPGVYEIIVTGTSSPSGLERTTTASLAVFNGIPDAPALTSPADGAIDQPSRPSFLWSAVAQAETYTIEIATDDSFTDIVDSAGGLSGTSHQPTTDLTTNTEHFWRVRALNICGTGSDSEIRSFITAPGPGDCAFGVTPHEVFFDDLENGTPDWSHSGTLDTWTLAGTRTHSGANAWYAEDVDEVSDQLLDSPAIALPAGEPPLTLGFWNWQGVEDNPPGCYDGGVLEISTDDGSTWIRLEAEMLNDPYDGVVDTCCGNPLEGENAWCGDPRDWLESVVDLDAFAGQTVRFRFRLATDSSAGREGWYVDDVAVRSCPAATVIFTDGFESGDTSAWSAQQP